MYLTMFDGIYFSPGSGCSTSSSPCCFQFYPCSRQTICFLLGLKYTFSYPCYPIRAVLISAPLANKLKDKSLEQGIESLSGKPAAGENEGPVSRRTTLPEFGY